MQISKDMLIGELIQMDELIAPAQECTAWDVRLLRAKVWKRHVWFMVLTVILWLPASMKFWQAANWEI